MGGVSSWLPESGTPSGVPTLTAWGGPHKYKVYTLSPHYEKRYPPLPKVPLFAVEIETHPLGEGYKLTCPTP